MIGLDRKCCLGGLAVVVVVVIVLLSQGVRVNEWQLVTASLLSLNSSPSYLDLVDSIKALVNLLLYHDDADKEGVIDDIDSL